MMYIIAGNRGLVLTCRAQGLKSYRVLVMRPRVAVWYSSYVRGLGTVVHYASKPTASLFLVG